MLQTAINFRPLGKLNSLYRCGSLSNLSTDDAKFLKENLNITQYADLRSEKEQLESPPTQLIKAGINWRKFPMRGVVEQSKGKICLTEDDYSEIYFQILRAEAHSITQFLLFLVENSDSNIVFGCYIGKDRTGVISALILGLSGHSMDDIASDYSCSRSHLLMNAKKFQHHWEKRGITEEEYIKRFECHPEIIITFCKQVEKYYGSWSEYCFQLGIHNKDIEKIKRRYRRN